MPLDPNDEEARKKKAAENPLTAYFGAPEPVQQVPTGAPVQAPPPVQPPPQTPQAQPTKTSTNVGGRAPTGFTNFGRIQSANRAVSNREAAAYGQRAQGNAAAAKAAQDALYARFGGQLAAGTVADPNAQLQQSGGPLQLDPMSGLPLTNTNPTGLDGGLSAEQMYANGEKSYMGPGGLYDVKDGGVDDVYDKTLTAEENLGALVSKGGLQALIQKQNNQGTAGTSGLSSALIGGAGRKDFEALRRKFNPEADMTKAEDRAGVEAKGAKEKSDKNAAEWGRLGDVRTAEDQARIQKEAKDASDKAAGEDTASRVRMATIPRPNERGNIFAGLDPKNTKEMNARGAEYAAFQAATRRDAADEINQAIKNVSLSERFAEAGGGRNPVGDWFSKTIHPEAGKASGSTTGEKIPWEPWSFWVYRQMDDKQWDTLRRLPLNSQRGWITQRMEELSREQAAKDGGW